MFTARLTAKPVKNLNFGLGYKYNDRDNKTPINTYAFYDAEEAEDRRVLVQRGARPAAPARSAATSTSTQSPVQQEGEPVQSPTRTTSLRRGSRVKGDYEYQQIDRNCPGSWINCADATEDDAEHAAGSPTTATSARRSAPALSYAYSQRSVDYDPNAWLALVPMANFVPGAPTVGATTSVAAFLAADRARRLWPHRAVRAAATGQPRHLLSQQQCAATGAVRQPQRHPRDSGDARFNMADRDRNKVRASLDWQALEALSVQAGVEYVDDDYTQFGLRADRAPRTSRSISRPSGRRPRTSAPTSGTPTRTSSTRAAELSYSAGAITNAANVGGVAGNTVVSGRLLLHRDGQERQRQDRPVPQLDRQRARPREHARPGLQLEGPHVPQARPLGRRGLHLGEDQQRHERRNLCQQPVRRRRMCPRTRRCSSSLRPTCPTSPTIRSHCGCWPSTTSTRNPRSDSCTSTANSTPPTTPSTERNTGPLTQVMPTNQTNPNYNVSVFGLSYALQLAVGTEAARIPSPPDNAGAPAIASAQAHCLKRH